MNIKQQMLTRSPGRHSNLTILTENYETLMALSMSNVADSVASVDLDLDDTTKSTWHRFAGIFNKNYETLHCQQVKNISGFITIRYRNFVSWQIWQTGTSIKQLRQYWSHVEGWNRRHRWNT